MRMWMTNPKFMCRKHLLGEHGELHKFLPTFKKQTSIAGLVEGDAIEPLSYFHRHEELAAEMVSRGYKHNSAISTPDFSYLPPEHLNAKVDRIDSLMELIRRCPDCTRLVLSYLQGLH